MEKHLERRYVFTQSTITRKTNLVLQDMMFSDIHDCCTQSTSFSAKESTDFFDLSCFTVL